MENKEIMQKLVNEWNSAYHEYQESKGKYNDIIETIRTATNGTFISEPYSSTLMGYQQIYDKKGREITCDPNYKSSSINIEGKVYPLTRRGWHAYIWKPDSNANYTSCWSDAKYNQLLAEVDLTPDYVKEYWKEHGKYSNCEEAEWLDYYVEEDHIVNPNNGKHGTLFNSADGTSFIVWKSPEQSQSAGIIYAPYLTEEKTPLTGK